ncbi:hypothetical protein [Methylobacterium fujisawaense]
MPQFVLDLGTRADVFASLDSFTQGYVECAIWADCNADSLGIESDAAFDDLSLAALSNMIFDCADFQAAHALDLEAYEAAGRDLAHAGHDFWLSRNGHGTGFGDRGMGELGERLHREAKGYGGIDLYVGDDGKIYG